MRPLACDRSRSWISLRLDDELSRFEHVLLGAHLAICRDCRRFAADLEWQTECVRSAALAPLTAPVTIPPARSWRRPALGASAAAVAASIAALTIGLRGPAATAPNAPTPSSVAPAKRADRMAGRYTSSRRTVQITGGIALRGDATDGS